MIKLKSYTIAFHRRYQGQSMAEFCVAAPVLILLWWSIWYLTDMYLVKHETLVAARYGTWLLSRYDNVPENQMDFTQVSNRIKDKFFKNRVRQNILIEEDHEGSGSHNWEPDSNVFVQWVTEFLANNMLGADTPRLYRLKVKYKYPRVFGAVDLREGNQNFFNIKSEHAIIGNSWDGQRVEVHDLVTMIERWIEDIIEEVF